VADQFLPQRYAAGQVAPHGGGAVNPYQAAAATHAPGDLHLAPASRTMDECWELLSPKVRQRMLERAGQVVDRWLYVDHNDRVAGVLLGSRGLVTAEPTYNASGGHATAVQVLAAEPGSARSVQVDADTTVERYAPMGGSPGRPAVTAPTLAGRLPADFVAFLGNLPARAQTLLQDPFVGTARPLYCDHYYRETGPAQGAGGRTLRVWCYLTDRRRVTFASGHGFTFGATFVAAVWQLTCRRFDVAGPAGTAVARR
jgi:hypothetical protein